MDTKLVVHDSPQRLFRWWPALSLAFSVVALLLMLLLMASPALAPSPSFPDVPPSYPYHDAIVDLASRGIISGYTGGRFGPDDPVKRQQFAKMIVLTGGYPASEADVCPFTDVERSSPPSLYPDHYVAVAAAHQITVGTSPGLFSPGAHISRFQVISMVVRAADDLNPGLLTQPTPSWNGTPAWGDAPTHGANARRAEYNGLLAGLPLATLDPWGEMPRGEVAQVLHNLLGKLSPVTTTTALPTTTTTTALPTTTTTTALPTNRFIGSGDDVVTITKAPGPAIIYIEGNASSSFFAVTAYGPQDDYLDLLLSTWDPYQGIRPLDFDGGTTETLAFDATGNWTIEIRPLSSLRSVDTPGTISGFGDEVFQIAGSASTAHIEGNAVSGFFAVVSYGLDGYYQDLLVNTFDPYSGTVMLSAPSIVDVQATGSWSFAVQP